MGLLTALAVGGAASAVGSGIAKGIAAKKQAEAAKAQQKKAINAAKMTPQELKMVNDEIREGERMIARERKVIEAVDPALLEAGKQAYQLLRGKESALLDPVRRNRDRQREVLNENLRRQLGPGFETSSAGIEALSKFDTATSDMLSQVQERAALGLLSSASNTRSQAAAGETAGINAMQNARGGFQNAAARQVNAITGTSTGVVQSAGGFASALGDTLGGIGSLGMFGASNLAGGKNFFGFDKAAKAASSLADPTIAGDTSLDFQVASNKGSYGIA